MEMCGTVSRELAKDQYSSVSTFWFVALECLERARDLDIDLVGKGSATHFGYATQCLRGRDHNIHVGRREKGFDIVEQSKECRFRLDEFPFDLKQAVCVFPYN
jgi:hypothetical protein